MGRGIGASVAGKQAVRVHVVPAVEMQCLCPLRALCDEASLDGYAARRRVLRAVIQFQAVEADIVKGPVRNGAESKRSHPPPAESRKNPVRHFGPGFLQGEAAERDATQQ